MIKLISSKELKEVDAALMLTTDEEIGGFNGVKYLLEEKGYSCDCAVIPDGGDNFQLTLAEKGVVHIKLNARGKSAHGSRPWLGENAIEKLIRIYQEIKNKMPETTPDNRWQPTVNLGRLTGGKAANVIPSQAEMLLDFRYPQNRQRKRIISLVKKACQKNKEVSYQVLVAGGALVNRKNNKYIQNVLKTAANHNIKLKYHRSHGASDGRFFSAKNIPVIIFKPVCSEPHIKDEWVDLKSLEKFSQILKDFLLTP